MEVKFELDTEKALKAALAIAAAYGLCCVSISKGTKFPQLTAANALALIVIIAILYSPCPVPKKSA
jgi:hypothetical protein